MGTKEGEARSSGFYERVFALVTGAYLMLIGSSLILYWRRKQEKYLFAFCAVSVASLAVLLSSYNFNYILRLLLIPPLLLLFGRAKREGRPGACLLAVGYGISEGARIVVYLANTPRLFAAGELLVYLWITQMGYLADLILCMVLVLTKFADKFNEAEMLIGRLDELVAKRTSRLEENPQKPRYLRSVRGYGYYFSPEGENPPDL